MSSTRPPVLLVHGIWGSSSEFRRMSDRLISRGASLVHAMDLDPCDGSASLTDLAGQVERAADELREEAGVDKIDLVGFSMGALACRYYLQRSGGTAHVRRFVSISGPHAGTWIAYFLPLRGIRQMRPNSEFLRDLDADADPFPGVDVFVFYTPLDLTIVPFTSSKLKGAREVRAFPVPLHALMLWDRRVHDAVADVLA